MLKFDNTYIFLNKTDMFKIIFDESQQIKRELYTIIDRANDGQIIYIDPH